MNALTWKEVRVEHIILDNDGLRTLADHGGVDCVKRVGDILTGQDVSGHLLVCQRLCRWYVGWVAWGSFDSRA